MRTLLLFACLAACSQESGKSTDKRAAAAPSADATAATSGDKTLPSPTARTTHGLTGALAAVLEVPCGCSLHVELSKADGTPYQQADSSDPHGINLESLEAGTYHVVVKELKGAQVSADGAAVVSIEAGMRTELSLGTAVGGKLTVSVVGSTPSAPASPPPAAGPTPVADAAPAQAPRPEPAPEPAPAPKPASPAPPAGPATLASLAFLQGPSAAAKAGSAVRLQLLATYSDGSVRDLTRHAVWVVSNPAIAQYSYERAELYLMKAGTVKVSANVGGKAAFHDLTVGPSEANPATVSRLVFNIVDGQVEEVKNRLIFGGVRQLVTTSYVGLSHPTLVDKTPETVFTSSDPAVLSIEHIGADTFAVAHDTAGSALVTANVGGTLFGGVITVEGATLLPAAPLYVVTTPSGFGFPTPGQTFAVTSVAFYMNDGTFKTIATTPSAAISVYAVNQGMIKSLGGWSFSVLTAGQTQILFGAQDTYGAVAVASGP